MSSNISITINNEKLSVAPKTTVLQAAKQLKIQIPTLCQHPDLKISGNCRICVVEIEGARTLQAACSTPVRKGMKIVTNNAKIRQTRKQIIGLLLAEHNADCLRCDKNGICELQSLAQEYGVSEDLFLPLFHETQQVDTSSPSIRFDPNKCVRCQRCVRTCEELQGVGALVMLSKGADVHVGTFFEKPLSDIVCSNCGQCVNRCPTGALTEISTIEKVWNALEDPTKHVVVETAPAVRIALGEMLGYEPGERVTGKMVTALRMLGFNRIFDTNFTADLTIIEEGYELLNRLKDKIVEHKEEVRIPMFTSCSPGWIKYSEHLYSDLLENLSTCKSPQQMFGALAKSYYAQKAKIDPKDIVVVSVMPCTAKKYECVRPEMTDSGYQDVDYILTTRELGRMIRESGIDFMSLKNATCDSLLGMHSGAGVIFGATGGVMEAALRTAYELVTGREVPFKNLNIQPVRGMEGVKEATIKLENCVKDWAFLEGVELKVAVAHGLANAHKLAEQTHQGKSPYHFIEIMACPGGCLGGGGQPIPTSKEIREKRMRAVYAEDESLPIRKSHENPEIKHIYANFLGEPLSHKSHELLHTSYKKRSFF